MKVDASPTNAPATASVFVPRVPAGTRAVPLAIAGAPVPVVGATNAPLNVAARLDGAAEKNLRATLAQLKEDVSPKSLRLAVNKLATHARQDVHAALKAMLGGDADAVAKFVRNDHFDFARAELKAIAAKLPARVVETTERVIDFDMGVVAGSTPVPAPALFGYGYEYEMGQRVGAAVGLAGDAAAFLVGGGMTGSGGVLVAGTGGAALLPGAGISEAGLALAGAASVGAAFHGSRFLHPLSPPSYEARAKSLGSQPRTLNEQHILRGEVKAGVERPSVEVKAEQKRLLKEKETRPLTLEEQKVFEKKPVRFAQGFHLESSGGENARVVESTRTNADRHGVYEAVVEVRDPSNGKWVRKERESSFFPVTYSEADVRSALKEAYGSAIRREDGSWLGTAKDGMKIVLIVDEGDAVVTAYALMESIE